MFATQQNALVSLYTFCVKHWHPFISAIIMPELNFAPWGWMADPVELGKFHDNNLSSCLDMSPSSRRSYALVAAMDSFTTLKLQLLTLNRRLVDSKCESPFLVVTQQASACHMANGGCKPFCGHVQRCYPKPDINVVTADVTVQCHCSSGLGNAMTSSFTSQVWLE